MLLTVQSICSIASRAHPLHATRLKLKVQPLLTRLFGTKTVHDAEEVFTHQITWRKLMKSHTCACHYDQTASLPYRRAKVRDNYL